MANLHHGTWFLNISSRAFNSSGLDIIWAIMSLASIGLRRDQWFPFSFNVLLIERLEHFHHLFTNQPIFHDWVDDLSVSTLQCWINVLWYSHHWIINHHWMDGLSCFHHATTHIFSIIELMASGIPTVRSIIIIFFWIN